MILESIEEFILNIPTNSAIMGLDLGEKTIGIAVSDRCLTVATGIKTIKRTKFQNDLKLLLDLIKDRQIGGIILGLPKNMNGSEGPRCQSTRAFARNMSNIIETSISFWDERLSTVAAERILLEANASRKRRSEVIDYVAASYILQGVLNRIGKLQELRLRH
jgi:putative Holliday junction resolvase